MPDVLTPLGNLPANTPGLPAPAPAAAPAPSPVLDPTGTVPVAGSVLDPLHPANPLTQPAAAAPAPSAAPSLGSNVALSGNYPGLLEPGNIDLTARPVVKNPDGSISTVRSASFNFDGKEVLLPTVSPDGRLLSDDEAVALYKRSGQHLGKFDTPDNATAYAQQLHNQQAAMYLPGAGKTEGPQPPPGSVTEVDGSTTMPGPPSTPEEAARRQYEAAQGVAKTRADEAANAADLAKVQTENDAKKADLLQKQVADQAAEDARQRAGLDAATKERDRLRQDVRDFKFHNFWDTRSTGQELIAGLGMILGGASFSANHENQAVKIVDNAIAREWQQQQATLEQKIQSAKDAGEDVRELQSRYQVESGKLKLRQEAQLNAFAAEADRLSSFSRNQAGVLTAKRIAAEARGLAEQQGQAGLKEIAAAHTQKLKDAETRAQTANIYSEIAERAAKNQRDRTGALTTKEALAESKEVYKEYKDASQKAILDPKTGILPKQRELDGKIAAAEKDSNNPLTWVALIDSMGKTNSGGKLTQAQYQIILGHSAGSTDKLDQEIAKIRNGGPSKKQRANILQAAKDAQSELYQQGHDAWEQFHGAVESDPRYKNNPHARIVLNQMERNTFSGLHGYGQSAAPAGATPQQESALKNGFKVIK